MITGLVLSIKPIAVIGVAGVATSNNLGHWQREPKLCLIVIAGSTKYKCAVAVGHVAR